MNDLECLFPLPRAYWARLYTSADGTAESRAAAADMCTDSRKPESYDDSARGTREREIDS